jgi:phage baseplate assembly protein W
MSSFDTNNSSRQSNVRGSTRDLVGISYPFRKEDGEFPKKERNIDLVSNDLTTLFKQAMRSRVMRPLLGTMADRLVFEPIDQLLLTRLLREVARTINVNDPRIVIDSVTFSTKETAVDCSVVYFVNGVRQESVVSLPRTGL